MEFVTKGILPTGAGVIGPVAAIPSISGSQQLAASSPSPLPGTTWDSGVVPLNPPVNLVADENFYAHIDFGGTLQIVDRDPPSTEIVSMELIGSVLSGPSDDFQVEVQLDEATELRTSEVESIITMSGGSASVVVDFDFIDGPATANGITIEALQDGDGEIEITALRVVIQADSIAQLPVGGTTELLVSGSDSPSENTGSSSDSMLPVAAAAGGLLIALASAGLFMRRRLVR